jgi:DNA replication and repair protein RecF
LHVKRVRLRSFRNYASLDLQPDSRLTVLCGPNAQGKTNVLEALHLCCLGRSHRTSRERELIRWGEESCAVQVFTEQLDGTHEVSVQIYQDARRKKIVRVGGTKVARIGELMGHLNGVLFSPEDLSIVKDGPGERRRFIDMELSQLRPAYFYALQQYVRALNQRNNLLREIARNASLLPTLEAWDEQLARTGAVIVTHRRAYIARLCEEAAKNHAAISGGETLSIRYQSQFGEASRVEEAFMERLHAARREDLRRATSTVGAHRDDLRFEIGGKDARMYASQGQQRTIVLSLKLAEIAAIEKERGETPVLMLDDVMSELDPRRREMLVERLCGVQTLVTCTDRSDLAGAQAGAVYRVQAGEMTRLDE